MGAVLTLEPLLQRNVRDVMAEYPVSASVLSSHGIGCATCAVGTCLLRDIIDVHGLSTEQERSLMAALAAAIFPGQEVALPRRERRVAPAPAASARPGAFSPPVRRLVQEHMLIKRVLALVPAVAELLERDPARGFDAGRGFDAARGALDFIRTYADKYHHAKEEDILFGFFDPGLAILQAMRAEHESARSHVREAAAGIEQLDAPRVVAHLRSYASLLAEHIRKEDEILYPFLDARLTDRQVGEMFARFSQVDAAHAADAQRAEGWVAQAEEAVAARH
jgi:hemerythrin-like domain-containing protein